MTRAVKTVIKSITVVISTFFSIYKRFTSLTPRVVCHWLWKVAFELNDPHYALRQPWLHTPRNPMKKQEKNVTNQITRALINQTFFFPRKNYVTHEFSREVRPRRSRRKIDRRCSLTPRCYHADKTHVGGNGYPGSG